MNTLRLGTTGDDVKKWQGIIGVTVDGSFGAGTLAATKDWQRKHKLAADGVVGPASWAFALGEPVPSKAVKTSAAPTDAWAYNIAKTAAPTMKENHRQYALAVTRGEGFYGRGWNGSDGGDSNNWGAVQGVGDAGAFQHIDHHADGTQYTTNFKKYSTPEAGFLDAAKYILKPNVMAALDKGNLHDAVYAQHDNRYFELAPDKYLASVVKNYDTLLTNLDWKRLLSENGMGIFKKVAIALGLVSAVALGIFIKSRGV